MDPIDEKLGKIHLRIPVQKGGYYYDDTCGLEPSTLDGIPLVFGEWKIVWDLVDEVRNTLPKLMSCSVVAQIEVARQRQSQKHDVDLTVHGIGLCLGATSVGSVHAGSDTDDIVSKCMAETLNKRLAQRIAVFVRIVVLCRHPVKVERKPVLHLGVEFVAVVGTLGPSLVQLFTAGLQLKPIGECHSSSWWG